MRPGQLTPNAFEIALLERVAADNADANICIAKLHVLSRTFTGVGSYTDFLVQGQPKTTPRRVITTPIVVTIPSLQHGLGVVVFIENEKLTLETYSFDQPWDGVFEGFSIGATGQTGAVVDGPLAKT